MVNGKRNSGFSFEWGCRIAASVSYLHPIIELIPVQKSIHLVGAVREGQHPIIVNVHVHDVPEIACPITNGSERGRRGGRVDCESSSKQKPD